jgi:hypothetical protein
VEATNATASTLPAAATVDAAGELGIAEVALEKPPQSASTPVATSAHAGHTHEHVRRSASLQSGLQSNHPTVNHCEQDL